MPASADATIRRPRGSTFAFLSAAALIAASLAPPAAAQPRSEASPYLSLDHWAYPILDLWIARGDVVALSPMTRPYRVVDVVRAVRRIDPRGLPTGERETRGRLLAEISGPEERLVRRVVRRIGGVPRPPSLAIGLTAGGSLVSQTHPDPLQAALDGRFGEARFLERAELAVRGQASLAAAGARIRRDGIYRHDPRFPGGQVTPPRDGVFADDLSLRAEEAYVELQVPYARIAFGRLDRAWGPATADGFLRSAHVYSQDELAYRFGGERIFLTGTISAPDDFRGDTVRYLSMHRLEVRPSDRLALAVSEAVVHGGPDGRFRFALANPIGIWQIAVDEDAAPHNKLGQVDVWWRAGRGVALSGSLLADATNRAGSCCQMGGTLAAEFTRLAPGLRLGASVSAIQSLAYRTSRPWEEYSVDGVGLGWDKSDLVLVRLEADWFMSGRLRLSPRVDVQRLGEGDFRSLRPSGDLSDQPRLLSGTVETTVRPALAGRFGHATSVGIEAEWDVGLSRITSYRHVAGDDRTELSGSVTIRFSTPVWRIRLR